MVVGERARVVVIGGGVVGCAIARAFVRRGVDGVVVLEGESDVGEGASKANSAIVHTGFDATPGTIEARLLRASRAHWATLADELGVPFLPVGAVMLARSDDEADRLRGAIAPLAERHGVRTETLDTGALRTLAGYVADDAVLGLWIPDESIVDPFWLTRAYGEAAMAGGAEIRRDARVSDLAIGDDAVKIRTSDGTAILAEQVVDAAGLHAATVARMAGDDSFEIRPRKGQFLVSEETFGVDHIVLPVPGPMGKGMLVTPIVFGGLLLGPTAVDVEDPTDRGTDPQEAERILAACRSLVPALADVVPVRSFAGLRTVSSTSDFVLGPSLVTDRLWFACGIRSTGISASPAIAEDVVDSVLASRGWHVTSPRIVAPPPVEFPEEPGEIVCLCRGVSAGELRAACARPLAPRTIDGLKRRGGATFGDCQGNLCTVGVADILAAAHGLDIATIEKGGHGSHLFTGRVASGVERPPDAPAERADGDDPVDVVVIGAGRAGRAAYDELEARGLRTLAVERTSGRTAIGLVPDDGDWIVETAAASGSATIRARAVLLATGGYVEPREHGGTAGPRPAGVVTSDFVRLALAAGLLPGSRALVVGAGREADETADALAAAGCEIVLRSDDRPTAIDGPARLTTVQCAGRWLDVDLLVLADRRLPQPFLLRGLGLVDGRPGMPAPVDADGRTPMAGLWAAGCCVHPEIDHVGCAADGRRAARTIAAAWDGGRARSPRPGPST